MMKMIRHPEEDNFKQCMQNILAYIRHFHVGGGTGKGVFLEKYWNKVL